jgi:cell division transport system permease protein
MAEFRAGSGYAEALDLLKDNPLPATIVITVDARQPEATTTALFKDLSALPEVEHAKLDEKWLQRLYAILTFVQRVVTLVSAALVVMVLVVIGNTIRLDIENRRQEIEVMKLIGANDRFIRRPFLYTGLWYGLTGALLGCLLVEGAAWLLSVPAQALAGLYGSQLSFGGLTGKEVGVMFGAGALLGWLGAWWAVSQRLWQIEPR